MTSIARPNCLDCKHYKSEDSNANETPLCKAYPDGIPEEIYYNEILHDTVRKDQEGTYVFRDMWDPDNM